MPEWTKEQQKAIDSRDGTILVSAAAGSGKTAVLVERVLRRLTDEKKPCTADRLLIVTFTRAAAKQIRDRIFQAISEKLASEPNNALLKRQLIMLPFAKISTVDSFCNDIVRENFHNIDLAPDYRIMDGAEQLLLENDAVKLTADELYKEGSPEFFELVNILSVSTDDSAVTDLIMKIYNNSTAFARPDAWLDSLLADYEAEQPLSQSRWGRLIIGHAAEAVESCAAAVMRMRSALEQDDEVQKAYSANVCEMETVLAELAAAVSRENWDEIREAFTSVKFSNLGRLPKGYCSEAADLVKRQKKSVTETLAKKIAPLFCVSEAENRGDMEYLKPVAEKLIASVKRYAEILMREKRKNNSYDFSDIAHFALNLLVEFDENGTARRTETAAEVSGRFDEILVDEFQDINELQNSLFSAVSDNEKNLFMVGDVKQSIYRFRQAMPEIFLSRRDGMPDYEQDNYPAKISLDRNFRSRSGVTENVNFVFTQLMSKRTGGVDYGETELLTAAADYGESGFPECELHLVTNPDGRADREREAQHVADVIKQIISDGMQVKDKNGCRPATYRDICILLRVAGGGKAETYARVLAQNNIPVYVSNKSGFFASSEISLVLNLMRITDNPVQDVPLLAVMLSPLFGFTADELAQMRIAERKKPLYHCVVGFAEQGNKKCRDFLNRLASLRMLSSTLSCADFVREIYDVTGIKAMASAMENGSQRNANLNMLAEYAAKYEETGRKGLSGFIRFIDRIHRRSGDLESASELSEAADAVNITTIHKSKGLEYPVCIIADLNSPIRNDNRSAVTAFHPDCGVCFDRRDGRTKCRYSTVGVKALTICEQRYAVSEELRVLYVAMTRAKERLICVTRYDNPEAKLQGLEAFLRGGRAIPPYIIESRASMADWLLLAFLRHPDAAVLRNMAQTETAVLPAEKPVLIKIISETETAQAEEKCETAAEADGEILAEIKKRIEYVYPYASLANVRAKSAPSELEHSGLDLENFACTKPRFLSAYGLNPAARGTATHKFMEFCDFFAAEIDVDAQIEKMAAEKRLTEDEAAALDRPKLRRFFKSDIALMIRSSPMLMREKKVTVGVRAGDIYPDLPAETADETVVIQGYVDCAFEKDGGLVIVDYKTDKVKSAEVLRERYGSQLKMYELALQECTGMKIKGTLIYSFETGEYIRL